MTTRRSRPLRQRASFLDTRWSLVARAASEDRPGSRQALEELCEAYWKPMYIYARSRGLNSVEAEDAVQGLLTDILSKQRLVTLDATRGRFRDWLRTALKFYIGHERERASAQKRGGHLRALHIDQAQAEHEWSALSSVELDPQRLFDRAWALEVMRRALDEVERDYAERGKQQVFDALRPTLTDPTHAESLVEVARKLGMSDSAIRMGAKRLRERYRAAIRAELRPTVSDPSDEDAEYILLRDALG
jgi:RNA polymerase sigma-70 factor (ECF subfamily)